ncbi:CvfD/Ygs/GSP13 family RNA-binding post-transcriptional regulator [Jeotgalibaca sp. MA1X17-3]|uniref:CvfD/Ygs/GSP13 family RNA-binding post-transcriptional regulator n=1 Tax=Jeotgalibaca sp. MA1X17-3 TaxID=2908211 RepID=UPI001F39E5CC|nr:CvfD/Ygs/GSP13 family RNA-binding post-transcriptional regulator [Jeotgalibaca sp. MA1X17-3]UJF14628.1 CvfD/Ygs/GSP13 family RNA-binding post-transcriptional regulator [Jeotgalibaca sp. MA1X17-3]
MKYRIGDVVTGKITGIQSYGIFVALDKQTQGLIHISECKHGYVTNLDGLAKQDEDVVAKIIDIDEYTQKISLSLRALDKLPLPAYPSRKKYKRRRYSPHIGFVSLRDKMPVWIEEAKQDEKSRISEMVNGN